jgi:hypothetical protein
MELDIAKDIEQQLEKATAHLQQSIPVPTDATEDQAVEAVIHEYRERTGVELDEPAIRAEVRWLQAEVTGEIS